jgi:predicted double-glycine peptidase
MLYDIYRKVWVGAILAFVLMGFDNSPALACPPVPPLDQVAKLIRVPLVRQGKDYTCGVAAFHSVIAYYGEKELDDGKPIREDNLIRKLRTNPHHGTNYPNILAYAEDLGYEAQMYTDQTLDDLEYFIDQGKPTIVIIQAWAQEPVDWPNDWEDGHYVVAVGYDKCYVYFMDPSTLGNYTYIPRDEFMQRWHDGDRRKVFNQAAIVIDGKKKGYCPNKIKRLR